MLDSMYVLVGRVAMNRMCLYGASLQLNREDCQDCCINLSSCTLLYSVFAMNE